MSEEKNNLSGFAAEVKGKTGFKRVINAGKFSIDGLTAAFIHEAAFRQLTVIHSILIISLVFLPLVPIIKMILLFASVFSLVVELFNTAIEAAVDHTSTDKHPLAKIAKDVGSSAQMLTLGLVFILWIMAILTII